MSNKEYHNERLQTLLAELLFISYFERNMVPKITVVPE